MSSQMLQRILASLVLAIELTGTASIAAERCEVALTVSLPSDADETQKNLAGSLLALLESQASDYPRIGIVERMQIDLVLNELILDRALNVQEQTRLQLDRLVTADLILTAQFLLPKESDENEDQDKQVRPQVLVRIVEALTGAIRGVTVSSVDETSVDTVASQIARYLSAVIEAPDQAGVTVAIGTFESTGRFDRLRPLEFGIRDMVTAGLLNISRFRVLQRSGMSELNRELDLIRSGLADQSQLPRTLPSRKAAYLLHGTIDERTDDHGYVVIVDARLVHAMSGEAVLDLQCESAPKELPASLTQFVDRVASYLVNSSAHGAKLNRHGNVDETELLYQRAVGDVRRFRRRCPIDFSYRNFQVPGEKPPGTRQPLVLQPESMLGRHLLSKSIDRLESVLFIQPEHRSAAYTLGFCYSYNIEGIWNPKRAEMLLRSSYDGDPHGPLGAQSLRILAELSFHHSGGRVDPLLRQTAAEQITFAFTHMPTEHRSFRWPRMLELLAGLRLTGDQAKPLVETMRAAAALAGQVDPAQRANLAKCVSALASSVSLHGSPELKSEAQTLLMQWGESGAQEQSLAAARRLGYLAVGRKDYSKAIHWFLKAAEICQRHPDQRYRRTSENFLMHAGRSYRLAGQPAAALRLLKTIENVSGPSSLNRGYVDVEIGACYEALGKPQQALQTYITAAEEVPHLPDNSDVRNRILRLGGVPLRENRDFDVRYVAGPDNRAYLCRILATDGRQLFCGGGYQGRHAHGVLVRDLECEVWQEIDTELGRATCLAYQQGQLWVGTDGKGLWRYDLTTKEWKHWSANEGLPDERVVSVTGDGASVYVGVGTRAAGGLVQIDADEEVDVFDQENSPTTAPTHVVVRPDGLLVRPPSGVGGVHQFDRETRTWQQLGATATLKLFAGESTIWASAYGKELYPFVPSGKVDQRFQGAWFPRGLGKAGYQVRFLIERDGQIWFGGSPWQRFKSTGFYRVDARTGAFFMYGPRDGFRLSTTYEMYDGVWAGGRLWLATSAGLAEVDISRVDDKADPVPPGAE